MTKDEEQIQREEQIWTFLRDELGIHSKNALYIEAFTHKHDDRGLNNQRLAFLGDRVLSLIIRQHYFLKNPKGNIGDLTNASIMMEKKETLGGNAPALQVGELLMGPNVPKGEGPRAEALEALFGAIYLDQGFEKARSLVEFYLFST